MQMSMTLVRWMALPLLLSAGAAQGPDPAISIAISMPEATVDAGSAVKLTIAITNVSKQTILVDRLLGGGKGEFFHEFEVRDARGGAVAETKYYRQFKEGTIDMMGHIMGHEVEPGESLKEEVTLNKLYDLSLPGQYTIQARRLDHPSKTYVKSNTIKLTVK